MGKLKEKASLAHIHGMLQSREQVSELEVKVENAQSRSLRNIQGLERRLTFLRERYDGLANHRTEELTALREDIVRLQHAVRQCEKLATHCVGAGFHGRHPAPSSANRHGNGAAADALGALALGPAVRRLRKILERCEQTLNDERQHHQSAGAGRDAGETAGR